MRTSSSYGSQGPALAAARAFAALALLSLFGIACAGTPNHSPTPGERRARAERLASAAGFERLADRDGTAARSPALPVAAWIRRGRPPHELRIYLEGDGLAWRTRRQVSSDPTPVRPIALELAILDAAQSDADIVYLARPCQYAEPWPKACQPRLWTSERFGDEVLDAVSARLEGLLAAQMNASARAERRVHLIGYSGGGVLAALLAGGRDDIDGLVTIAAPLDLDCWTRRMRVAPLLGSHAPSEVRSRLADLPQLHFAGTRDRRVPTACVQSFVDSLPPGTPVQMVVRADAAHADWPDAWASLLARHAAFWESEATAPSPAARPEHGWSAGSSR